MGVTGLFGLKKLHLKNQWNLDILLFISCWKVIKSVNFNKFHRFKSISWAQNVPLPPFLILLTCPESTSINFYYLTNFYQILSFTNFYTTFTSFYYLPLTFTNFLTLYYFSSIKNVSGYVYHLVSGEFPFATTCSEKE